MLRRPARALFLQCYKLTCQQVVQFSLYRMEAKTRRQHAVGLCTQTTSAVDGSIDTVVIGAGVVGLAAARALAQTGREVLVIEKANAIGTGTSSRNSEIVHAGIYYPPGSLKAKLCMEGRGRLYAYCEEHGVPHKRLGKLLVATEEEEVPRLRKLLETGHKNGVNDLVWLDSAAAKALEPELRVAAALHSPSTGIVDSHSLMLAYQADAERHGATVALNASVVSADFSGPQKVLRVRDAASGEETEVIAREVVNAAGLHAPAVAATMAGLPQRLVPRAFFARGHYFSLTGKSPFRHLIYPLPEHGGLGVHLTLDMAGIAKFGPDVEWVDGEQYAVDPARADSFYPAIRTYFPGLKDGALAPSYSGIRPKISGPGEPSADFVVQGAGDHGVPGLVNLFGIESPGLTSSLALADLVVARLADSKL